LPDCPIARLPVDFDLWANSVLKGQLLRSCSINITKKDKCQHIERVFGGRKRKNGGKWEFIPVFHTEAQSTRRHGGRGERGECPRAGFDNFT
jgi:hypothetical protein